MSHNLSQLLRFFIALATVASCMIPVPALATANKSIVETGPYTPGSTVTVQIDFTKPNISVTPSAELVVVVDTSGSIASTISTMKSKLINFVNNTLQSYPGAVRVGIVKIGNGTAGFDDNTSNDSKHAQNANMYPSGSTNAYSNSTVGYDKVATISTSADYTRLVNAINAIAVEPASNPNSPDGANSYTSDIGVGLNRAAGMFHADSTSKFVILITDGLANKSYCPIDGNNKVATTFPAGTFFQLVPGGTEWSSNTYVQTEPRDGNIDPIFPSSYPTTWGEPGVCYPYIHNYHSATGWQAQSFTQDIANHYGPNSIQSTDIDSNALTTMINDVKIDSAKIDDNLNPSVFSSVGSWVGMYDCSSGSPTTKFTGNNFTPSGTEALDIAPNGVITKSTRFCARFQATLASNPPGGSQSINTSGNVITYYNKAGDVIATDPISQGSMSIVNNVDLAPSNFTLTDANGTPTNQFLVNQPIYVKTDVTNSGSGASAAGAVTRFYSNQQTALPQNSAVAPDLWFTHTSFAAGANTNFGSYPTGSQASSFGSATANKYWTQATPGTYYGQAFVNYQGSAGPVYETNYGNNQSILPYTVVNASTISLNSTATTCTGATLSWNDSASPASYVVTYAPTGGSPASGTSTASKTMTLTGLTRGTSYTYTITPYSGAGGTGYAGVNKQGSFTLSASDPTCLSFTLTPSGSTYNRGGTANALVNIDYLQGASSNKAAWAAQNAQLAVGIVKFVTGADNCSSVSDPTAYNNTPPGGSQMTAVMASTGTASITEAPPASAYGSPTVAITIGATTPVGTYTLCIGGSSSAAVATDSAIKPLQFSIKPNDPWLQIGTTGSFPTFTGDVHSNGDLQISAPSSPVQQYFFANSNAGVVSAAASISPSSIQVSSVLANSWKWASYHQVSSPLYSDFVANSPVQVNGQVTSGSPSASQLTTACSATNPNYQSSGTVDILAAMSFAPASCEGKNVIFFINGDLNVHANITDSTKYGTLTFIIKGNLTLDSTVGELDGVYLFGGAFSDGASNIPLMVKGSLLGLGGTQPTASTGTFRTGAVNGFQRDLVAGNDNTPAEVINFQPKYLNQVKSSLGSSTFSWSE